MSIRFGCRCGKQLVAPESRSGSRARCPACGAVVEVPRSDADDLPELLPLEPTESERHPDPLPDEKRARRKSPSSQPDGESTFRVATGRQKPRPATRRVREARAGSVGYGGDLKKTFLFPGNANSLIIFAIVWLMLCLKDIILPYGLIFGLVGRWIIYGWYCAFRFSVIAEAASGEEDLPRFSVEDIFPAMIQWWATWAVALLPVGIYVIAWQGLQTPEWLGGFMGDESAEIRQSAGAIPVYALMGAGMFLWPMLALCVAMGGFSALTRWDLILLTVAKSLPVYFLTVVVVFTALMVLHLLELYAGALGFLGMALLIGVGLYLEIVALRMIGLYYHHFKHRFAWSWG